MFSSCKTRYFYCDVEFCKAVLLQFYLVISCYNINVIIIIINNNNIIIINDFYISIIKISKTS